MKLGDLCNYAQELGIPFAEFMQYLTDENEEDQIQNKEPNYNERMQIYISTLSEELQELACNLVQQMVNYNTEQKEALPIKAFDDKITKTISE